MSLVLYPEPKFRAKAETTSTGPNCLRTSRGQLVLHLQQNPLSDVLQQADDLLVPQLGQIDAVHRLDVVTDVQLVAPEQDRNV